MFDLIKYGIYISAINSVFLLLVAGLQTRSASERDFSQLQYSAGMSLCLTSMWMLLLAAFGVFQYFTQDML